jgi:hypothetical protein
MRQGQANVDYALVSVSGEEHLVANQYQSIVDTIVQ